MSDEILINRKDAKAAGLKFYFTGKLCKHGHIAQRYVKSGICFECSRQYSKQFYQENEEDIKHLNKQWREENANHIKQYSKQWYQANSDHSKQCHKQWYKENADAKKQYNKQWHEENPDYRGQYRDVNKARYIAYIAKRRATKLQATPSWAELDLILRVYEKRDELNSKWGTDYQVDHIIPLRSKTVCGLHVWANLQLLEAEDNGSKTNNYQQDW